MIRLKRGGIHPACSDVMEAIMARLPEKEISPPLLKQLLFLADWRHLQRTGQTLTGISWFYDSYGPYAKEVYEVAMGNPKWEIDSVESPYGILRSVIRLRSGRSENRLSHTGKTVIDELMMETRGLNYLEVCDLVRYTPPIKEGQRGHNLDLHRFLLEKQA